MLGVSLLPTLLCLQIAWSPGVQVAKSYALKTGKPLFVVMRSGAGTNGAMARCVEDPRVIKALRRFVCVFIDREPTLSLLTKRGSAVDRAPVLFLEGDGRLISRLDGFMWPQTVVECAKRCEWIRREEKRLRTGKADPRDLAILEASQGNTSKAAALLREARPDVKTFHATLVLADQYRIDGEFERSLEPLRRALAMAADGRQEFAARVRLASSLMRLNRIDEALAEGRRCKKLKGITREERDIAQFQMDVAERLRR